jgi:hypothetical protein
MAGASGVSSQVVVRAAIDVEMDWNTYLTRASGTTATTP